MKTFDQCKDETFKGWWFKASEEVNEIYRQAAELYAQEVAKDASVSFGTWYSGMTKNKVEKAYERYLKEVNQPNQEKP